MLNALVPGVSFPFLYPSQLGEAYKKGKLTYEYVEDGGDMTRRKGFRETERHRLCPAEGLYGIQIPANVWHTVEVIEPSVIFEAKDGAYKGDLQR